jgi:hypothetical protein
MLVVNRGKNEMTNALKPNDIRDFLNRFASAIMRDQGYVDELPLEQFHPQYDDSMWREWRLGHLAYLNMLHTTVNEIPSAKLKELTRIALAEDPAVVRKIALELFGECVSGSCPREDVATAELFFDRLIHELNDRNKAIRTGRDAKALMSLWIATADPLRIGRDAECGYGDPCPIGQRDDQSANLID